VRPTDGGGKPYRPYSVPLSRAAAPWLAAVNPARGDGLGWALRECWWERPGLLSVLRLSGGLGSGTAFWFAMYGGTWDWLIPVPLLAWLFAAVLTVRLTPRIAWLAWERACLAIRRCPACYYALSGDPATPLTQCPECGHVWSLAPPPPEPPLPPARSFRLMRTKPPNR
jgi:hypothetical protein